MRSDTDNNGMTSYHARSRYYVAPPVVGRCKCGWPLYSAAQGSCGFCAALDTRPDGQAHLEDGAPVAVEDVPTARVTTPSDEELMSELDHAEAGGQGDVDG